MVAGGGSWGEEALGDGGCEKSSWRAWLDPSASWRQHSTWKAPASNPHKLRRNTLPTLLPRPLKAKHHERRRKGPPDKPRCPRKCHPQYKGLPMFPFFIVFRASLTNPPPDNHRHPLPHLFNIRYRCRYSRPRVVLRLHFLPPRLLHRFGTDGILPCGREATKLFPERE